MDRMLAVNCFFIGIQLYDLFFSFRICFCKNNTYMEKAIVKQEKKT